MRTKSLVLSLLGALAVSLVANDIEPSKENYTATRAGGPIVIDGNLSEWAGVPVLADPKFSIPKGSGTNGTLVLFEICDNCSTVGTPDWTGPDDQTSAVQIVWDADNVYFGFVVTDDYHENAASSAWNGDSVQLMIANSTRTIQEALYNYSLGGVEGATLEVIVEHEAGRTGQPAPGVTEAVVTRNATTKKTIYEIKVPVTALAAGMTGPLTAGTRFGLGMSINDGDEAAPGQQGWGGLGAHSIVFGKTPGETALVTLGTNLPSTDLIFLSAINPGIAGFTFRASDKGASIVAPATAKLTIDGTVVALTPSPKTGDATDFRYTAATPFTPGSAHTYSIEVKDTSGGTVTDTGTFTTPIYGLLNAADRVTADTTKPGFIWNVHQVDSTSNLATVNSRTEQQLAGLLGDNIADPAAFGPASGPAAAPNPSTAPITFIVPGVINFSQTEGDANGNVTPDLAMPGIPGTTGGNNNIAAEVLTVIEFPAPGLYRLIVNSDDAFKTTFGKNPRDAFSAVAGEFNAGRGAADTAFDVFVPAAGAYPMRTSWNEGGGGANIEILSQSGADKILLNDTANTAALKTYQLNSAQLPAFVRSVTPGVGQKLLSKPTAITAVIVDGSTIVTGNSGTLKLNGVAVATTSTKSGNVTTVTHTPTSLQADVEYTAELTYTDSAGPRTVSWKFTPGAFGGDLFVIEAEDFDYDGGLTNPKKGEAGQDVNVMPYFGGAYITLAAVEGVDYNNNDANDSDQYRAELDENGENEVNIVDNQAAPAGNGAGGNIGIAGNDRITFQTTANWRIGWVGGDWQNYTRTFPTTTQGGWWKVYAGLSHGEAGATMSGRLERVNGGWGTPDQTVDVLGSFTAPASGTWGNNNLVPMKTATGADAIVKLVGTNTVRFNNSSGDFDFLIFTPASPPPPSILTTPFESIEDPAAGVLIWTLQDSDVQVVPSSVRVFLDDVDVSTKALTTKTGAVTTVRLDMTGTTLAGGVRKWRVSFGDNSTPPVTTSGEGSIVVAPFAIPGIFAIEAEDFNYSVDGVTGGLWNPKKGEANLDVDKAPYDGAAYDTLSAVEGVDYNNNDANDSDQYRTELDENGENEVNITASNGQRYSNERGSYDLVSNYRIGWVGGGDWQNYTRTFPSNTYNVYAGLSYGGEGPGLLVGSLDRVTSNPAQPNQTTERLGTFNAPGTAGWGRNELVVMKDASGNPATVTLGGVQTVRFNLGSGDFDFLLFVPATAGPDPGDRPRITAITRAANGSITVTWTGGGQLEAAAAVTGPWQAVAGATTGTYTFTPAAGQNMLFGRIRR
jgi:hypothetical protein